MPPDPPSTRADRTPPPGPPALPRIGARLGDYVLERELGKGGMGAVYLARHATVGAPRAIKVLAGRITAGARERFDREARALAKLDKHPAIVDIHEAGVDGGVPFLVLELVEGTDLERALEQGPLPVERVVSIGAAVADALAHCHARGVLHRDLKPANVLLRRDGTPVVTDFGVARDEREERMTVTGVLIGSPQHMAPEQVSGEKDRVGPWTDVFALGGLLHVLLTGELPFKGDSLPSLAAAICSHDPPPLRSLRKDAPADLEALVLAALEKEPEARPSAAAVRDALQAIARGAPTGLEAPSSQARRARAQRLALVGAAAVALLVGAALAFVVVVIAPRTRARATLADVEAWTEATLDPWALGVADDAACPAPVEELRRRQGELAGARERLRGEERARAEALVAGLLAAIAAEGSSAGPPSGPLRHVCDALLLLRTGDRAHAPQAALARVEQALAADPGCRPARLLQLRLLAETDPRTFLVRARRLARPDERAVARRAGVGALARLQAAALAAPERAAEGRRELDALAEHARALEVPLDLLVGPKVQALEAAAPAWGELLAQAARRGAELEPLRRLGALLHAPPAARPGPALSAAIESLLGPLLEAAVRSPRAEERRALERLLAAEAVATYEVDPGRACPPALEPLLESRLTADQGGWRGEPLAELTLACLRAGTSHSGRRMANRLDPEGLAAFERWRTERPRSLAVRYGLAVRRIAEDNARFVSSPEQRHARTAASVEPLVEPGLQQDLAPRHQADAWLHVATWRRTQGALAWLEDPARGHALGDEAVAHCRRARAAAFFGDDLGEAFRLEAQTLAWLGRREEMVALLREGEALFEARIRTGVAGAIIDQERHDLAGLLLMDADQQLLAGRRGEALRLLDRAEEVQRDSMTGDLLLIQAARAQALRLEGDLAAARAALRSPTGASQNIRYAAEAIRLELAAGDQAAARALLARVRGAFGAADELPGLEREVESGRPLAPPRR